MTVETPAWVRDAVFYQIFPDRFARSERVVKPTNLEPWDAPPTAFGFKGGDLFGVAERLDYLSDLGVNALYFTPVFASAANHRYHTWDYLRVDPLLGGDDALRTLLDAAHARGIKVVLDGVFNHTGRGFYQFHHLLENGAASPYLDWFHVDEARLAAGEPVNAYPPHPKKRGKKPASSAERYGYTAWWDLPALPKLNTATPAVRRFLFDVAERWVRFGIDGWRLDVPREIDDDSFWQELRQRVKAINPDAYLVGEVWEDATRWLRGDQFDAVMNYPLTRALLGACIDDHDLELTRRCGGYRSVTPLTAAELSAEVARLLARHPPAVTSVQLNLLDSHDTPRFLSSARGDETALRLAALLLFTLPGAPCVYYGDEIGLEGREDPDCRRTFPWDEGRWNRPLRATFRHLVAARHALPALRHGTHETLAADDSAYVFSRTLDGKPVVVAVNLSRQAREVALAAAPLGSPALALDLLDGTALPVADGLLRIPLPPRSGRLLKLRRG